MARMTMIQALRSAMDVMLERDPNVVIYGQDVGYFGGVFRCTEGLQAKFGRSRVFDAPISEGGIVGSAIGMAAYGLRPVVEVQFADYFYPASDQIVSEAARLRYRSAGDFTAPITIRMPCGGGIYGDSTLALSDVQVLSSTAVHGAGAHSSGSVTIAGSTFAHNAATGDGGGLRAAGCRRDGCLERDPARPALVRVAQRAADAPGVKIGQLRASRLPGEGNPPSETAGKIIRV